MGEDTDRPQDAGRRHRRRATLGAADAALLDRWHESLRRDLGRILDELEAGAEAAARAGAAHAAQTTLDGTPGRSSGIDVKGATPLYDLGIKLARELGAAIVPAGSTTDAQAPRRPRGRADFG